MPNRIIAHTREDGSIQSLPEHIEGVAQHCAQFLEQAGLPKLAPLGRLLAQLHDAGKAQLAFQRYILGESTAKAPHSAAGALLATSLLHELSEELQLKKLPRTSQLLAYAISGHHRGLYDYGGLEAKLKDRETKDRCKETAEALTNLRSEIQSWAKEHAKATESSLRELAKKVGATEQAQALIRLLFSCLVDADFLDTEAFMDEERKECRHEATSGYASLEVLKDRLTKHMEGFSKAGAINEARRAFLNRCREHV